jgi:hypothetical protein
VSGSRSFRLFRPFQTHCNYRSWLQIRPVTRCRSPLAAKWMLLFQGDITTNLNLKWLLHLLTLPRKFRKLISSLSLGLGC